MCSQLHFFKKVGVCRPDLEMEEFAKYYINGKSKCGTLKSLKDVRHIACFHSYNKYKINKL